MRFVETFFTRHHLRRAPHRWVVALLLTPIHMAEVHYQRVYHLRFAHARKLFLFDLSLVVTMIVVVLSAVVWWKYDPTITNLMYVSITPSSDRVMSGEYATYTIAYENDSDVVVDNAMITLMLPPGFVYDTAEPLNIFDRENKTFALGVIDPKSHGTVHISGWMYGVPEVESVMKATLHYRQDGKRLTETKVSPHLVFLRGSVLVGSFDMPTSVVAGMSVPFTITLTNTGDDSVRDITVPLDPLQAIGEVIETTTDTGVYENGMWSVQELLPDEIVTITGTVRLYDRLVAPSYVIEMVPTILVDTIYIPQSSMIHQVHIAQPAISLSAEWDNDVAALRPGDTGTLRIVLTNTGSLELTDLSLELLIHGQMVSLADAARQNNASIIGHSLVLNAARHPSLAMLSPRETRTFTVVLPVSSLSASGVDIELSPVVRVRASASFTDEIVLDRSVTARAIPVGTDIQLSGSARYYTNEGDQLGRGPLPPEVGKETRYAVIYTIRNSTSNVRTMTFVATLHPSVMWTGKASVTHGSAPQYDTHTHQVRWNTPEIPAHTTASIFFELGYSPSESDRGEVPLLISQASVLALDTYLQYTLSRSVGMLDGSLIGDIRAIERGVRVR